MISHVTIAISDFDRALAFYRPLMRRLGIEESWLRPGEEASFRPPGQARPLFFLTRPFEGAPHPGNGPMVAFLAQDRATVRDVYEMAITAGATDEGRPDLRPHYHPDFYGAYFRDLDGNKICVACHVAEGEAEAEDRA
ncbi:VOC family protein [Pseudooceanicola sp. HF7]|uniref:VOC family protein n=1 Tax=Pseudooceanicola sp. HF7 TaxID=2721560 RepID=UPI0014319CE6|nr:VOC family protein [Pseudooceanicola sp. HF7]NIZ11617.1 VOC family protein [Pseudooceanicola sp. HF7]